MALADNCDFIRIATPVGVLDVRAVPNPDSVQDELFQIRTVEYHPGLRVSYSEAPTAPATPLVICPIGVALFRRDGTTFEEWCSVSLRAIGLPSAESFIAKAIEQYVDELAAAMESLPENLAPSGP